MPERFNGLLAEPADDGDAVVAIYEQRIVRVADDTRQFLSRIRFRRVSTRGVSSSAIEASSGVTDWGLRRGASLDLSFRVLARTGELTHSATYKYGIVTVTR